MLLSALFGPVAVVQLAIVLTLLRPSRTPTLPPPSSEGRTSSGATSQALLSRLPNRLGKEVVALEAEDHYLRVHTTLGSDLILMRLSDAIAAIGPDLGLQVHRSWWVAHYAIIGFVRSEQGTYLSRRASRNASLSDSASISAAALKSPKALASNTTYRTAGWVWIEVPITGQDHKSVECREIFWPRNRQHRLLD